LLVAIAVLLVLGLVIARGRIPRRRGLVLVGIAVALAFGTEALIATDAMSVDRATSTYGILLMLLAGLAVAWAAREASTR
jgi:peptidoglycan/LPS O-acetylase OafA/YrhL